MAEDVRGILEIAFEHHKAKRYEEALSIFDALIQRKPENPMFPYLMGSVMFEMGRYGGAIAMLTHAITMGQIANEKMPEAANNLGAVLRRCGHDDSSMHAYKLALEWSPDNPDVWTNISGYWINQGNPDECLKACEKALSLNPNSREAKAHRALALLEKGEFETGWPAYMDRYYIASFTGRNYPAPARHWSGEKTGKLVIHGEQGIGDEILFMGFAEKIRQRGLADTVIVECEPRLIPLFERSFGWKCYGTHDEVLANERDIDHYCPMGTLPVYLGPLPERRQSYLIPNAPRVDHYRERIEALGPGPYIGLSWKGGTQLTHEHLRNPGKEHWQGLISKGGTYISLQYGLAGAGAPVLGVPHWQEAVDDIDELAALIKACDIVISVCNSTVHIAGGLGVPVWIATPAKPAWRYQIKGEHMPWYPSSTMVRQVKSGDWSPVFAKLGSMLGNLLYERAA